MNKNKNLLTLGASGFLSGTVPVRGDVVVVFRGETGARAPEVCSLFTVSLVALSVADVFTFEMGDFDKVDEAGRGFRVDVKLVGFEIGALEHLS